MPIEINDSNVHIIDPTDGWEFNPIDDGQLNENEEEETQLPTIPDDLPSSLIIFPYPFGFTYSGMDINYNVGSFKTQFHQLFDNTVFFTTSNSEVIKNISLSPNKDYVNFDVTQEGISTARDFTITARTNPNYTIDVVYDGSNSNPTVFNSAYSDEIELYNIDGEFFDTFLFDDGTVEWSTTAARHVIHYKLKPTYDLKGFLSGVTSAVSVRIAGTVVGENFAANATNLEEVAITDTVKKISSNAFKGCTSLGRVWIGEGVDEIGDNAFSGDTILNEIYTYVRNSITLGSLAFKGIASTVWLYNLDDGTHFANQWKQNMLNNGVQTVNVTVLDWPEEGNEYNMYLSQYDGVVEDMDYYDNYYDYRISTLYSNITLHQEALNIAYEFNVSSIISVNVPSLNKEYVSYKVINNGQEIYSGKKLVYGETVEITLQDIVENFITTEPLVISDNRIRSYKNYGLFELYYSYDDFSTIYSLGGVIKVYNDWSYSDVVANDTTEIYSTDLQIWEPIFITYNLKKNESAHFEIRTYGTRANTITRQADYTQTSVLMSVVPQPNISLGDLTKIVVTITPTNGTAKSYTFNVVEADPSDKHMRMIFRNLKGGYSVIPFNRYVKKNKNIDKQDYKQPSSNSNAMKTIQYKKVLQDSWTCYTPVIDAKKTDYFYNSLASTEAYIQESDTYTSSTYNKAKEVNIVSTSVDRKTYWNQGKKLFNYEIKLQDKEERKFI